LLSQVGIRAKRRNVRKYLSLQKKECKIVLPTYEQKLYENKTDVPMCDLGDIKAAGNIIDLNCGDTQLAKSICVTTGDTNGLSVHYVFSNSKAPVIH